ncbi:fluoride efflux transporter CrcB [Volucribacter amazonae]|uniref:Fluoride-specific ion channel FluC n=1 Tax=Volucribacter amazonae TaxID=256731 RepID=A0A9X4SI21_9PAST|nr:fluoride efflux transporter CrcB [Volucribacter amazonae]MDG6895212.1 chromosome condensation protein CrcB [Volucribacter amazonae]
MMNFVYLCIGAILGATGRWGLTLLFNPILHSLQLGTLLANYIGCLLIGIMLAVMLQFPQLSTEWKLFFITGFLGSFTTFSSFSAEIVQNLLDEKYTSAFLVMTSHLLGGILCTFAGFFIWRWFNT